MFKKIFILFVIIISVIIGTIYIYRHAIIKFYAEKIIRENLPGYIKIDKINFDFVNNKASFGNFKILNPPGFSSEYLINIKDINCRYRIRSRGIMPEGLEIVEVMFKSADLQIERLKDGKINVIEMGNFLKSFPAKVSSAPQAAAKNTKENKPSAGNRKLSDIIKLPQSFGIRNTSIAFLDALPYDKPHLITVDSINGNVSITFDDNYSKIISLAFTVEGNLNGLGNEIIKWAASLDPTTPRLTMSNRFDVSDLDILDFAPYYDKFSPFVFERGRFSGTLVFDFNNGNIGSTNEVHLSNLSFSVKPGYENAQMWETNVPDLMRYFTTPSGDIVFDFKLKGGMASPTVYLGPISKRALASMAIDKVASYAVNQVTKQADNANGSVDKAKEAIDTFRRLLKK